MPPATRQFLACLVALLTASQAGAATLCWGSSLENAIAVPSKLDPVVQLASYGRHNCAIVTSGDLDCWGMDWDGQSNPPNNGKAWTAVATGLDHSCAVQDGFVTCWGKDKDGQSTVPGGLNSVAQVSAGFSHSCALKQDGAVQCWGKDGEAGDYSSHVPTSLPQITLIASGGSHTCGVSTTGTVHCWGLNYNSETVVPSDLGVVVALGLGESHTCVIEQGGTLRCWGLNDNGQTDVPSDLGPVASVAAGGSHTCTLDSAGSARCWGNTKDGRLVVPAGGPWGLLAAGLDHTCGVELEPTTTTTSSTTTSSTATSTASTTSTTTASTTTSSSTTVTVSTTLSSTTTLTMSTTTSSSSTATTSTSTSSSSSTASSTATTSTSSSSSTASSTATTSTSSSTSVSTLSTGTTTTTVSTNLDITSTTLPGVTGSVGSTTTLADGKGASTNDTTTYAGGEAGNLTSTQGAQTTSSVPAGSGSTASPAAMSVQEEVQAYLNLVEAQKPQLVFDFVQSNQTTVPLPGGGELVGSTLAHPVENGYVQVPVSVDTKVWLPVSLFDQLNMSADDIVLVVSAVTAAKLEALSSRPPPGQSGETIEVRAAATIDIHQLLVTLLGPVVEVVGISDPVIFELSANYTDDMTCEFWDTLLGRWSTEGVQVSSRSIVGARIVCETSHLSLFGAIVRGFLDTLKCANFDLLQAKAIEQVFKGTWYTGLASIIWFCLIATLVVSFVAAMYADNWNGTRTKWSDEFFLIPVMDGPSGSLVVPPEFAEKYSTVSQKSAMVGETSTQHSQASAMAGVTSTSRSKNKSVSRMAITGTCLLCSSISKLCRWLKESSAMKEALDDIVGSWFEYFADLRAYCEGLTQGFEAECVGLAHGQCCVGGSVFLTHVLLLCSRRLAGSTLGISDSMVVFIMDDEDLCEYLMLEHNEKAQRAALSKNSPTRSDNQQPDPAGGVDAGPTVTASSAGGGTGLLTPAPAALQPPSLQPMQVEARPNTADTLSTPGNWRQSKDQHEAWVLLHDEVSKKLLEHADSQHGLVRAVRDLFVIQTPLGSAFIFDIFISCKERVLLLAVELVGSFCLASVFFQATGFVNGKPLDPDCSDDNDAASSGSNGSASVDDEIGTKIGRVVAIATVSLFLAVLPALILASLQTKSLKWMDYRNSPAWKRQLRAWRIQTRVVYTISLLYIGFCVFYVSVFLANLNDNDQENYCMSCGLALLQDFIILPFALSLMVPLMAKGLLYLQGQVSSGDRSRTVRKARELLLKKSNVMLPIAHV